MAEEYRKFDTESKCKCGPSGWVIAGFVIVIAAIVLNYLITYRVAFLSQILPKENYTNSDYYNENYTNSDYYNENYTNSNYYNENNYYNQYQ